VAGFPRAPIEDLFRVWGWIGEFSGGRGGQGGGGCCGRSEARRREGEAAGESETRRDEWERKGAEAEAESDVWPFLPGDR